MSWKNTMTLSVMAVAALWVAGCSKSADTAAPAAKPGAVAKEVHAHGEWWCSEHGVPEAICAQCKTNLAADFKNKGDWCNEHSRPNSQCFICNPEKQTEFAAQYEAKYGEKPPKLETTADVHKHEGKS